MRKKILIGIVGGILLGGTISLTQTPVFSTIQEVQNAENTYFAAHGEYLQVMPNNTVPSRLKTSALQGLGKKLPDTMRVDTYTTPDGQKGYQIVYDIGTTVRSVGVGKESASRTFDTVKPVVTSVASTTP